jgi:hypothetical protein
VRAAIPLIAALALLVPATVASGCRCATADENARYRAADAAFIGRLVSVRETSTYNGRFRYRVGRSYKRKLGEFVVVRAPLQDGMCGLPRQKRRYALYLERRKQRWSANLCSVTTPQRLRQAATGQANGAASSCRATQGV